MSQPLPFGSPERERIIRRFKGKTSAAAESKPLRTVRNPEVEAFLSRLPVRVRLVLSFPGDFPSTNEFWSSPHWSHRQKTAKAWHARVAEAVEGMEPMQGFPVMAWGFGLFAQGEVRRDQDALAVPMKLVIDGLVASGFLPNDSPKYVSMGGLVPLRAEERAFALALTSPL